MTDRAISIAHIIVVVVLLPVIVWTIEYPGAAWDFLGGWAVFAAVVVFYWCLLSEALHQRKHMRGRKCHWSECRCQR